MEPTHVFFPGLIEIVEFEAAVERVKRNRFLKFYPIFDLAKFQVDHHGRPERRTGGWSYGHVHNGWMCAGEGGRNSVRLACLDD